MYAVHKNHQPVTTNTRAVFSIHNSMSIYIEVWRKLRVQQAAVWRKMCTTCYCMEKNVYYKRHVWRRKKKNKNKYKRPYGEKCVLQATRNYGICTASGCMEKNVYYKRSMEKKCVLQATIGETVICVLQAAVLRQMCTTSDCTETNVYYKRLY